MRHSFLNPHHAVASLLHLFDESLAFVGKFNRIGSTRAEHYLGVLIDLRNRLNQLADALLARNAAHKQHKRTLRVNTPLGKDAFVESRRVEIRIDTIVNHLDAIFGNAVKLHHIALHTLAHGNHAVSSFVSGTFNPATHGVATVAQLFRLPRTVRFQRMRRENQRALQKTASENATKVAVPRMTVNYIDIVERGSPLQVNVERLKNLLESIVMGIQSQLARETQSTDIILVFVLHAKATRLDMTKLCKFLRQELHMDTSTTINFWGKLIRQNCSVHKLNSVSLIIIKNKNVCGINEAKISKKTPRPFGRDVRSECGVS